MKHELVFNATSVPAHQYNGYAAITLDDLAHCLYQIKGCDTFDGRAESARRAVNRLYQKNADEFNESMTGLIKIQTAGGIQEKRVFSLRGAHLIAMMSRSKVAKDFRRWLLDLIEKESGVSVGFLDVNRLTDLAGQQIHDAIDQFDKASFEHRGQKGSGLMAQRKRDIKKIKEATRLALQLTQFSICDLGDFASDLEVSDAS